MRLGHAPQLATADRTVELLFADRLFCEGCQAVMLKVLGASADPAAHG